LPWEVLLSVGLALSAGEHFFEALRLVRATDSLW